MPRTLPNFLSAKLVMGVLILPVFLFALAAPAWGDISAQTHVYCSNTPLLDSYFFGPLPCDSDPNLRSGIGASKFDAIVSAIQFLRAISSMVSSVAEGNPITAVLSGYEAYQEVNQLRDQLGDKTAKAEGDFLVDKSQWKAVRIVYSADSDDDPFGAVKGVPDGSNDGAWTQYTQWRDPKHVDVSEVIDLTKMDYRTVGARIPVIFTAKETDCGTCLSIVHTVWVTVTCTPTGEQLRNCDCLGLNYNLDKLDWALTLVEGLKTSRLKADQAYRTAKDGLDRKSAQCRSMPENQQWQNTLRNIGWKFNTFPPQPPALARCWRERDAILNDPAHGCPQGWGVSADSETCKALEAIDVEAANIRQQAFSMQTSLQTAGWCRNKVLPDTVVRCPWRAAITAYFCRTVDEQTPPHEVIWQQRQNDPVGSPPTIVLEADPNGYRFREHSFRWLRLRLEASDPMRRPVELNFAPVRWSSGTDYHEGNDRWEGVNVSVERGDGWVQLQVDTAEFFPYPGREYEVSYKAAITRPFNMPLESWYSGNLKIEVPPSIGPYEIVSNRGSKLKPISKVGRSGQEGRIPDIDEGECLGVDLLGSEIAPSIYLRNCEHRENQKWYLEADGSLRGLAGKCLTAALSTTGVVDIKLMDCEYPADQQWEFTPAGEIRIKGGDSCLDVQDGNPPRVILSRCTGADSQKWSKRPRASWLPSPGPPNMHILPLDISGRWKSSTGLTYEITQTGNTFEWSVVEGREKAKGTIDGKNVSAVWNNGANSAKGTITSQETNGKALKIQWDNGVVFERVVKGILTPLPPPKKIPVKPIEQSR